MRGVTCVSFAVVALSTMLACGSESDGGGGSGSGGKDAGAGGSGSSSGSGGGGAGAGGSGGGAGSGATAGVAGSGSSGGAAGAGGGGGSGGGTGGSAGSPGVGRFIAYRADAATDDVFELYAVNLAGASASQPIKLNGPLVSGGDVLGFSWSPDGTKLAYLADQDTDGVEEIYFVDMSSAVPGAPVKLNGPLIPKGKVLAESTWVWSPSSVGLVFSAQATSDLVYELFYVDTTQKPPKAERLHAPKGSGTVASPQFAPGSNRLAFLADLQTSGTTDLQVVDLTKPAPYQPVRVNPPLVSGIDIRDFSWSPDGNSLAVVSGATAASHLEMIDVSGSTPGAPVVLSATGSNKFFADIASRPGWLPDGTGVLYTQDVDTNNRYELFLVGISAGVPAAPIRMHAPLTIGRVWEFLVTPSSKRVAYRADTDGTSVEAWVVDTVGATPKVGVKVAEEKTQLGWGGMAITSDSKWLLLHVDDQLHALDLSAATLGTPTQVSAALQLGDEVTGFDVLKDGSGLVYRVANQSAGTAKLWWVSMGASVGTPADVTSGAGPTSIEPDARPLRADGSAVAFRAGSHWDLHVVPLSSGPGAAPTKVSGALPSGAFVLPGIAFGK